MVRPVLSLRLSRHYTATLIHFNYAFITAEGITLLDAWSRRKDISISFHLVIIRLTPYGHAGRILSVRWLCR